MGIAVTFELQNSGKDCKALRHALAAAARVEGLPRPELHGASVVYFPGATDEQIPQIEEIIDAHKGRFRVKKATLKKRADAKKKRPSKTSDIIGELRQAHSDLEGENAALLERTRELQGDVARLQGDMNGYVVLVAEREAELERDNALLGEQVDDLSLKNDELEGKLKDMVPQEVFDSVKDARDRAEEESELLTENVRFTKERVGTLEGLLGGVTKEGIEGHSTVAEYIAALIERAEAAEAKVEVAEHVASRYDELTTKVREGGIGAKAIKGLDVIDLKELGEALKHARAYKGLQISYERQQKKLKR